MTSEPEHEYGLGRLFSPDLRDARYRMADAVPVGSLPESKHWYILPGHQFNQKHYPRCVGFAWLHFLKASPIRTNQPISPHVIYHMAQKVDEWPGEDYDGTSVRAGAKVLQSLGYLREYLWGFDVDDIRRFVLSRGSVVVGTDWTSGMFSVDSRGYVDPHRGSSVGGHAYLILGYAAKREAFRCVNSWGRTWGQDGRFWITANDLQVLFNRGAEACSAVERIIYT